MGADLDGESKHVMRGGDMMRIRLIVIFGLLFLVSGLAAGCTSGDIGSQGTRDKTRTQFNFTEVKDRLNLTKEQEDLIRPVLEEYAEKTREIIEKYRGQGREGMSSLRSELQELREDTEKRLEEVLTEEQMEEWHKFIDEQSQMRPSAPTSGAPPRSF